MVLVSRLIEHCSLWTNLIRDAQDSTTQNQSRGVPHTATRYCGSSLPSHHFAPARLVIGVALSSVCLTIRQKAVRQIWILWEVLPVADSTRSIKWSKCLQLRFYVQSLADCDIIDGAVTSLSTTPTISTGQNPKGKGESVSQANASMSFFNPHAILPLPPLLLPSNRAKQELTLVKVHDKIDSKGRNMR